MQRILMFLAVALLLGCNGEKTSSEPRRPYTGYGSDVVLPQPGDWCVFGPSKRSYETYEISIDSVAESGDGWRNVYATTHMVKRFPCHFTGTADLYWYIVKTLCHQVKSRWAYLPEEARERQNLPLWETVSREELE